MNVARFRPVDLDQELESRAASLVGQTCEDVRVHTRTFGQIQLKLSRHELAIACSWRLDSETQVICGAGNSQRKGGAVQRGLAVLVGERIVDARLDRPGKDLTLTFGNGWTLSVFCSRVNEVDMLDNYSLETAENALIVGTCGAVREEQ
jgi:hypothetical protein